MRANKQSGKVSESCVQYIRACIQNYERAKTLITAYEKKRRTLLKMGNLDTAAFHPESYPTDKMLVEPSVPEWERGALEEYLYALEQVYLLEHGIWELEGEQAELAEDMLLRRRSREQLMQKWHLSQATLTRRKNQIIQELAIGVELFFRWKTERMYL